MSWANASYYPAVSAHVGAGIRTGKPALRFARQVDDLTDAARNALRRYSTSWQAGCEDGKTLNASLARGEPIHEDWAAAMDEACVWAFDHDVLIWRGGDVRIGGSGSPCFTSTSLVERSARKFRSRGGFWISAIVMPTGTRVAIPSKVWGAGDDNRTFGVVSNEVEVVLPRGVVLESVGSVRPFGDSPERRRVSVGCCRVS